MTAAPVVNVEPDGEMELACLFSREGEPPFHVLPGPLPTSHRPAHRLAAIFGANDDIAGGVWNEITSRGSSIPCDFSLEGLGDWEEFSILEPPLTTVDISPERVGQERTRMLLETEPAGRPARIQSA